MPSDVLTVREAAELLQCSEETVRIHARRGTIPALKIGGWRFRREDLLGMFGKVEDGPKVMRSGRGRG